MTDHLLIAGAQRSGTTFLYGLLDRHPEIEMARPLRPEPKFFLRVDASATRAAYDALFGAKPHARLRVEKSTSYMERGDVPARAVALLPGVKAVFLLRDPIQRAISNYRLSVDHGAETASLEEAFRFENERRDAYDHARFSVSPFAYLARGHYYRLLQPWRQALGRNRMLLIPFERLIREPAVMQELFAWLEVGELDPVTTPHPINMSRAAVDVSAWLNRELVEHFRESNRLLAQHYDFDISLWQA